jgi:peptide/nickel transport system substrate-binding protein
MNAGLGNREISAVTSGFLAYLNPGQQPVPYLAAELPSVDQGTWKTLPDGQMETTYRLKGSAAWHDGRPVRADDFVFGHQMHLDPDLPVRFIEVDRLIGSIRALDDQTLFIAWKEPYVWAGRVQGPYLAPLPRHLLGELYASDKDAFMNGAHWREQFIGAGPYKVERWEPGVELGLRAHERFALGKPAINQVTLRFIADVNTVVANLLSGAVDVGISGHIGFEQNRALEQSGWNGRAEYWAGNPRFLEFQTRDWGNLQRAVLDIRVRRAMAHAIDRQAIVDGLYAGKAPTLQLWLSPDDPAYAAAERAVPKYPYDPARAEGLLREAGWTRGADGLARNATGQPLDMPMLNESGDIEQLEAAVVGDYLKAIGITSEVRRLTFAEQRDGEFRSKFPAVAYNRRAFDYDSMVWLTHRLSTPENRWNGSNRSGYVNPLVEELWMRAMRTIDEREREPLLVEAVSTIAADAVIVTTHLQVIGTAYAAGLQGLREPSLGAPGGTVWNTWEWRWG